LYKKIKAYDVEVAFSGVTFLPNFMEVSNLVANLKVGERTDTGEISRS